MAGGGEEGRALSPGSSHVPRVPQPHAGALLQLRGLSQERLLDVSNNFSLAAGKYLPSSLILSKRGQSLGAFGRISRR